MTRLLKVFAIKARFNPIYVQHSSTQLSPGNASAPFNSEDLFFFYTYAFVFISNESSKLLQI